MQESSLNLHVASCSADFNTAMPISTVAHESRIKLCVCSAVLSCVENDAIAFAIDGRDANLLPID